VNVCVSNTLLGTEKSLCFNSESPESFYWTENVPRDFYVLKTYHDQNASDCLNTILKLYRQDMLFDIPSNINRMLSQLGATRSSVWSKYVSQKAHRDFTKNLVDRLMVTLPKVSKHYYEGTWVKETPSLQALKSIRVDKSVLRDLVQARDGNVASLKTFLPDENGFVGRVEYDRMNTLTGRLTVMSGPHVLTLKKEHRARLLRSVYDDGVILSVDFSELEPRICLYEANGTCNSSDLYSWVAERAQVTSLDRSKIKEIIISEIYGSGKSSEFLPEESRLYEFAKSTFKTKKLVKRLKQQVADDSYVMNAFGRPIFVDDIKDHVLVNYFAQSSGVDVVLLGFAGLIKQYEQISKKIRPLFFVHDAMYVDVPREFVDLVKSIDFVKTKRYVQAFPLKITELEL